MHPASSGGSRYKQRNRVIPVRWTLGVVLGALLAGTGCSGGLSASTRQTEPAPARVHTQAPPPLSERYCAWFGDSREDVLYFGLAAFWSSLRASGGDPRADLAIAGPRWIGRFSLADQRLLVPLDVGNRDEPSGVWDVLAHENGRVYFTTYFDSAGSVDPVTGQVTLFPGAGLGLNELAHGPDGLLLATRYGYGEDALGAVVVIDPAGRVVAEHPLAAPPGWRALAKSLAFDPLRREIWVNTDLLPIAPETNAASPATRHDTRVLGFDGQERLRFELPEVQFMHFDPDGTGYFAERDGPQLWLRIRRPERAASRLPSGLLIPLDEEFPAELDFVQEIRTDGQGNAWLTRWSGWVHRVSKTGEASSFRLPRGEGDLYYTGVPWQGGVCATRCGDASVVCQPSPAG